MSPTLDENATHDDPRVRRDHNAALLFGVLARAIQFDGLSAPHAVLLRTDASELQMNTAAEVDDWAARLGAPAVLEPHIYHSPRGWRMYEAAGALEGVGLKAWCSVDVNEDGSLVEHYHTGGAAGLAGENAADCACGVTFDGFDTHAEAVDALNAHIGQAIGAGL